MEQERKRESGEERGREGGREGGRGTWTTNGSSGHQPSLCLSCSLAVWKCMSTRNTPHCTPPHRLLPQSRRRAPTPLDPISFPVPLSLRPSLAKSRSPPPPRCAQSKRRASTNFRPKLEFVMEFLVQRRATYWTTSVYLPLLAMESIVPMAYAMPVAVRRRSG
eukprot:365928-Chlamydomonas_euryale.AAC.8